MQALKDGGVTVRKAVEKDRVEGERWKNEGRKALQVPAVITRPFP